MFVCHCHAEIGSAARSALQWKQVTSGMNRSERRVLGVCEFARSRNENQSVCS